MKIETNLNNNFFKIYDESRSVAIHRKEIIKNKKANALTFSTEVLLVFTIILLISLIIKKNGILFMTLSFIYLMTNIIRFISSYKFRKKQNFKNEIIIDEKGINDLSSFKNVEILFKWAKIKAIVIKKYSVTLLMDSNIYFYFDIKEKEKIIKEVKKYKKDIPIIN